MVPPGKRRIAGYSRRAQYGLFLGYVLAILGLLVAILMLVLSRVDPRGFDAIKGAALDVTAPISAAGRGVVDFFTGIGDAIGNYWQAGSQNEALKAELAQTQRELIAARAAEGRNGAARPARSRRRNAGRDRARRGSSVLVRILRAGWPRSRRKLVGRRVGQHGARARGLVGRVIEAGRWPRGCC